MSDLIAVHPETGRTRRATDEQHYQSLLDAGFNPAESTVPSKSDKKDVWAEYATSIGVTVPDDATKDDIIAAVEDAATAQ